MVLLQEGARLAMSSKDHRRAHHDGVILVDGRNLLDGSHLYIDALPFQPIAYSVRYLDGGTRIRRIDNQNLRHRSYFLLLMMWTKTPIKPITINAQSTWLDAHLTLVNALAIVATPSSLFVKSS